MKNDVIEALLGDEDDDDLDLGKEMDGLPDEVLNRQLSELLPKIIRSKEEYLGKPCVRTMQHTNPNHETFIYGKFGHRKGTMATLLFLDRQRGWIPADTSGNLGENVDDDFEEEDFKEVYGGEEPKRYLPIGSVSWGTMQVDDLIPRFLHALKTVDPARGAQLEAESETLADEEDHDYFTWETLFDALNDYAPPYTSFGSHDGDGSDYGIWISHESIEEALENEELRPMRKGESFVPGDTDVVLVDDSGNYQALLDGTTGREIWSI